MTRLSKSCGDGALVLRAHGRAPPIQPSLKIGQSFVRGVPGDEDDENIVRSIIGLAEELRRASLACMHIYAHTCFPCEPCSTSPSVATICRKHELDFADAVRVFSGPTHTFEDGRFSYPEARFITLGLLDDVVVVIAHTESTDELRIISMRKATRHEQAIFFENL